MRNSVKIGSVIKNTQTGWCKIMNGKKSIDFEDEEIDKLMVGDCVEKVINGEKLIVCGQKIDIEQD